MTDEQLAKIKEAAGRHLWHLDDLNLDHDGRSHMVRATDVLSLIARLEAAEARALSAYNEGIEAAVKCQPTTAENPYESAYQRGRFDAILKYTHAIRALLKDKPHG